MEEVAFKLQMVLQGIHDEIKYGNRKDNNEVKMVVLVLSSIIRILMHLSQTCQVKPSCLRMETIITNRDLIIILKQL